MTTGINKALQMLRDLPRVSLMNLRPLVPMRKHKFRLGRHGGVKCGRGNKGRLQRNTLPPIGEEAGNTPFHMKMPKEPYYQGFHMKKEYPVLSLLSLQRLIDLGRLDPSKPIDLTTICNTKVITIDPSKRHYGINLIDEGVDIFTAKVNIEVQWTNEISIAAIERCGGTITSRFYDLLSVEAMVDPIRHFNRGLVIPRCKLPPQDILEYYIDPKNRGYLADPKLISESQIELAQKYGYISPDIEKDSMYEMLILKKDPRQIWYGLEPGWLVNLVDKCILKPKNDKFKEYYKS